MNMGAIKNSCKQFRKLLIHNFYSKAYKLFNISVKVSVKIQSNKLMSLHSNNTS